MKKDTILTILVGIALILSIFTLVNKESQVLGAPATLTFDRSTSSAQSVSSTITQVLVSNPQRIYMALVNDGSNTVYCSLNATSTGMTAGKGIRLNANGGSLEFANGEYIGQVWCLTASGTSSLTIAEK